MDPLCTLRYSATHAAKHHMVYRLDAVDAYERKLVKQIEVAAATVEGGHNKPYVRLLAVANKRGLITAKVELDVQTATGRVDRIERLVQDGDDLEMTTGRAVYHDCRVGEIRVAKGDEFVELRVPGGEQYLRLGQAYGDVEPLAVQRQMIQRTIKEHLEKEKRLAPQGIKVLSLFFIDAVEKYRRYDPDGHAQKGDYARIFEEEYRRLAKHPDYQSLFKEVDLTTEAEAVHDGYFSIDKKGGWAEPELGKDGELKNQVSREAAERAYNLIMREKEKLLSFDSKLKFIFSHSALREGWDNPNVFQICVLRAMGTERERRQTIGRGLRLCVNQKGERLRGFETNTLTVVAAESYERFAENCNARSSRRPASDSALWRTTSSPGLRCRAPTASRPRWASPNRRRSGTTCARRNSSTPRAAYRTSCGPRSRRARWRCPRRSPRNCRRCARSCANSPVSSRSRMPTNARP